MNNKALDFIKKFSYTLSSNFMTLAISTLTTLIVPKLIGVEEYGLWQLFNFYLVYVGFFHLGWIDGIYLRYGGLKYEDLDKKSFFSQFISFFVFQFIIAIVVLLMTFILVEDRDRTFIFYMIALNIITVNVYYFFVYILQATNQIVEYAVSNMMNRIIFIILIVGQLVIGYRSYELMIASDLIAKIISLVYVMWLCRSILTLKITEYSLNFKEIYANINVGSKLLLANLISNLNIGIVRLGIERSWDVLTFGKISLTLSISNILLIFINGVATIIYPIFRRITLEKLADMYKVIRDLLTAISFTLLIFYYPAQLILSAWLPQYSESLIYMTLLLPMVIYEGKISLLINTYLKTLRKEKMMLRVNIISLVFSFSMTIVTTILFRNLNFAVLTILLVQVFRSILSEIYLSRQLNINLLKDIGIDVIMTIIFVTSAWYISSWLTVLVYGIALISYFFIKRSDLVYSIKKLKNLIKSE